MHKPAILSQSIHAITFGIVWLLSTGSAAPQSVHWAFKPVIGPQLPAVKNAQWVRNPIDAFILSRLEVNNVAPSPQADRRTLIRRVTFDLIGLPPTPSEVSAFLADTSSDAYKKVVDRLLASPHFGERWAQHWLDVVRFAESNGYEHDMDRTQAWRYRDWVVAAINADKPYDEFLRDQIAGDLLAPNDFDSQVATGFLRTGPYHVTGGNLDPEEMRQEWLTEAAANVGTGILGLTIGCARCHDHKYDPIPQANYYRLQAVFASTANNENPRATSEEKKRYDDLVKANRDRMKPIESRIEAIEKPYRQKLREQKRQRLAPEYRAALEIEPSKRTPAQKKLADDAGTLLNVSWDEVVDALTPADRSTRAELRRSLFALELELPAELTAAQGVSDSISPIPVTHLLIRGDVHHPGMEVHAGFPPCVAGPGIPDPSAVENPRLALARWLTAPDNPLTARVMVNRVWLHLFGRGLVSTPNDFGKNGQPPTNLDLLDWLAATFAGSGSARVSIRDQYNGVGFGWSLKSVIRLIALSSAYRQSSESDQKKAAVDPENRLVWRMNRKRMDAESLRDSILSVAGTLNPKMGGPSIRVPLEPEVYDTIFTESEPDNLWPPTPDMRQHTRRSLYLFRKRNVRLPMLAVFDQPDMMSSCAARGQTVHALQALTLINGDFTRKQSFLLTKRLYLECPASPRARIDRLFALALGRPPSPNELKATQRFLAGQTAIIRSRIARKERLDEPKDSPAGVDMASFVATADLCLATLNLNEFVYLR